MLYTIIDTEGHEPKVVQGMNLDQVESQKQFSLFQYELGGTWAQNDSRHGGEARLSTQLQCIWKIVATIYFILA